MLVLTRKIAKDPSLIRVSKQSQIVIGDNTVRIYVVDVKGRQVLIGIDAPEGVPINRAEIYDDIKAGVHNASNARPKD